MAQLGVDQMFNDAVAKIEARYNSERDKRLAERPQGEAQFLDTTTSEKWKYLSEDIWIDPSEHTSIPSTIDISKPVKYLITGTGFTSLIFAVRLMQITGAKPEDFLMLDPSGGYGGVWYWNRYPGLMCDVESYCYMPLLEETGYMPKHKYSYGPELRAHALRIAKQFGLTERTIFRQQAKKMTWKAEEKVWVVETEFQGDNRGMDLTLRGHYIPMTAGQLTHPKIPVDVGVEKFKGHMFHTSRWNYDYTGGSCDDAKAHLVKLKDKTVAIIGTGATAVQAIPELAKWAKKLYVIQRTPSSVDERGQKETSPEEWKEITKNKGWWHERNANFAEVLHQKQPPPSTNLVSDRWVVGNPSYCTAWGYDNQLTQEQTPKYVQSLHINDIPRAERIRGRVDEIVKDKATAEKLKHWYPTWCKRPCFHDDFLPAFNRPNVTLIDTNGRGIDHFTEDGVVVNGEELKLDLLILSTGYKVPFGLSPAARFNMQIIGKDGADMDEVYFKSTESLFGLFRRGFPNLFFCGASQASLTANQLHSMDTFATHIAYIIKESQKRSGKDVTVIEPTNEAQDDWADQVAAQALGLSGMTGCTPNYLNAEGSLDKLLASMGPEEQRKMMRAQLWGRGINHYGDVLENWRREGSMKGIEVMA